MESVVKDIFDNTTDDNKIAKSIFDVLNNFYKEYNQANKIKNYTKKYIKITKSLTKILVIREHLFLIINKYIDIIVDENINGLKKTFLTMKVIDDFTLNLFLSYCIFYVINNAHSKKKNYIGLDFEFSEGKIALCQIGFFPKRKLKYIFVLNPTMLSEEQKDLFIKTVFISNIHKVVHGAESLDIPYIFNELFEGNKDYIMAFTNYMYDTRFLCEYTKIYSNKDDRKCSIYDALLYFNVITKSKFEELTKNNEIMGPVQDVQWILKKMSSFHLKYVLYDVLYLKGFIKQIFNNAEKNDSILFEHLQYISPINRFVCLDKFGLTNILETIKNITDPINNYIAVNGDKKITLITIYNQIIEKSIIPSIDIEVKNLLLINNFKKGLTLLFKLVVFSIITNKYDVFINKKDKYKQKLDYFTYVSEINQLHQYKLAILLEKFHNNAKILLINIL